MLQPLAPSSAARLLVLALRGLEFDPDQPRDERGRWTTSPALTISERAEVAAYRYQSSYLEINDELRQGNPSRATKVRAKELDTAIAKSAVPKETVVYRGTGNRAFQTAKVGGIVVERGYSSTSRSQKEAEAWARYGKSLLHVTLPAGHPALDTAKRVGRAPAGYGRERELLLPRDTAFKITRREGNRVFVTAQPPKRLRGLEFDPDQPRDESGRWTDGGGTSSNPSGRRLVLRESRQRATDKGAKSARLSKLETGRVGEDVAVAWLQSQGHADARTLNVKGNNFPVDLVEDHRVYEVKAGLASNSESAQQWRATIGQPGVKEREWLASASSAAKARWGERKQREILNRKERAVREVSQRLGHRVEGGTIALIVNPTTRIVDVHVFDGFHARIGWKSDQAQAGYRGSYRY